MAFKHSLSLHRFIIQNVVHLTNESTKDRSVSIRAIFRSCLQDYLASRQKLRSSKLLHSFTELVKRLYCQMMLIHHQILYLDSFKPTQTRQTKLQQK